MAGIISRKIRSIAEKRRPKTGWDNITIGQYQKIMAVIDLPGEDHENGISMLTKWVSIIAILKGVKESEIAKWDFSTLRVAIADYDWITETKPSELMVDKFVIDDIEYKTCWDMKKISAGQFIDLNALSDERIQNLHTIMAVMCLPEKDDGDIEARAKIFQDRLSVNIAFSLANFFLQVSHQSLPSIRTYLQEKAIQASSAQNGDGLQP